MAVPLFHVDAFTAAAFSGNPAAVCLLPRPAEPSWMHSVAAEMNLSETAFLVSRDDGFDLRWFTPAVEVDLCGHATLASAHVLWETGTLPASETARFHTRSGLLTAQRRDGWIVMDFPARCEQRAEAPEGLAAALGFEPRYVGRNVDDYLLLAPDEQILRSLQPGYGALKTVRARGIIVTARSSDPRFDFVSRFFAPAVGVDEDPVTGSAHCCLGPFWQQRLGKNDLLGWQASRRGGVVRVHVAGDRVGLAGQAITVAQGELMA